MFKDSQCLVFCISVGFTHLLNDTELIYAYFKYTKRIFAEALLVFLWQMVKPVCPALQTGSRYFSCGFSLLRGPGTHSAILLPSSRLGGCELAVKRTRPPLVWFMSLEFWPLLSSHSGSGSLGTHAVLIPSCSETERGTDWCLSQC